MTRTKTVSLLLAVVLMLTAVAATPIVHTLASVALPGSGNPFVVMMADMPVMACGGCSGGGSGGG